MLSVTEMPRPHRFEPVKPLPSPALHLLFEGGRPKRISENPAVSAAYDRLSPKERRSLTRAFRNWVQRDCLGFTMLGIKPMSFLEDVELKGFLPLWKKIEGFLNREHFVLRSIPDWDFLFFAHKGAAQEKFAQHHDRFQAAYPSKKLSPQAMVQSLEEDHPAPAAHLLGPAPLHGTLLGYGAKNAELFASLNQDIFNGDLFFTYATVLSRYGPTETLSEEMFSGACQALSFSIQRSPLWEKQFRSPKHRQQVIEAAEKFMAMDPQQGIPKSAVFDIVDQVFPPEQKAPPSPTQLELHRYLEEGRFPFADALYLQDIDESALAVRLPYFRACQEDTEPAQMMEKAKKMARPLSAWVQSRAFFSTLLESLFAPDPQATLQQTLDQFEKP
jgi:hypothetical protein